MEIYVLRHGDAADVPPGGSDTDRALTPEGKQKLREVLKRARGSGVRPELILTSPLYRAVQTGEIAVEVLQCEAKPRACKALLPEATPEEIWEEIRAHKEIARLLLAGHEPLLGKTIGYLLGAPSLQVDLKKASMARIDIESFEPQPRGILRWLITPKLAIGSGA